MSAEEHKEQITGEVSAEEEGNDGVLSVVPSKRKLLLGGAIVVVAVVAYKVLSDGDGEDGETEDEGTEIEVESGSLEERLKSLDDNEVDVDDGGGGEERSFEETQKEAADAIHEDTPEFEGGE